MSVHNIVQLTDASCWPTIRGGKKVRQPFIFKITQQHTNNWEVGILLTQCTVFPAIDVPSLGYGQIYNNLLDDKGYDVTIGNFLRCSCVYFVTMLVGSLGNCGVFVQSNMCITFYRWLCFVGSLKSLFIIAHGVGMKFNTSWSFLKPLNTCDSISQSYL